MKSPFRNINLAFKPMFDEHVIVKQKNGTITTVLACVFLDNTGDALSETSMESSREDIVIAFSGKDICAFINTLKRGDKVERESGRLYAITEVVDDFVLGRIVKARSMEKKLNG